MDSDRVVLSRSCPVLCTSRSRDPIRPSSSRSPRPCDKCNRIAYLESPPKKGFGIKLSLCQNCANP